MNSAKELRNGMAASDRLEAPQALPAVQGSLQALSASQGSYLGATAMASLPSRRAAVRG